MNVTGSVQLRNDIYYMFVRYEDHSGNKKQKSKSTKIKLGITAKEKKANRIAAEIMLNSWMEEIKNAKVSSGQRLIEAVEDWLKRKKNDIRQNTYEAYEANFRIKIKPYWGEDNPKIVDISVRDVQRYVNYESSNGLSAKSIKKILVLLNGVFNEAVRFGEIIVNPCDKVVLPKSKKFVGQVYSADEAKLLLSGLEGEEVKPAIMIALFLGLRRSEIAGLRWQDIDFTKNIVSICNTVVRYHTVIEDEHTKSSASRRDLYLPSALKKYLLQLKAEQEMNKRICGNGYVNSGHVCQHADGSAFTVDYIYNHYKKIQKKLGLREIRLHDLRHTAGSLLINNGLSPKQVQEFLGHEQISTTLDIYTHIDNESKKETSDALGNLLAI